MYAAGNLLLPKARKRDAQPRLRRSALRRTSQQVPISLDRESFLERRNQDMIVLLVILLGLVVALMSLAIYDPLSAGKVLELFLNPWALSAGLVVGAISYIAQLALYLKRRDTNGEDGRK